MIENKYVPCLLHKKMCGPGECDNNKTNFRMRISLGWGWPNIKVSTNKSFTKIKAFTIRLHIFFLFKPTRDAV